MSVNAASCQCRSAVQALLQEQEDYLLQAGPRKFFAYVSKKLHPLSSATSPTSASGTVTDPAFIYDILSRKFSKNFNSSKLDAAVSSGCSAECFETVKFVSSLSLINFDISTARIDLSQLRDSATGPDGLPSVFFKRIAYWLAALLTIIYQQLLHQAHIPDAWRLAKVIPLYKGKGNKSDASCYRPISFTAIVCKVLECIIVDQRQNFLTVNSLICQEQHGFVPKRSTTTNLLQCDEAISHYLNAAEPCDVILLDFARAFDKVSHHVQMSKLSSICISGKLLAWLRDFLNNRTQFLFYQGAISLPVDVESEMVQGSVIGPLLFTVMINDLPQQVTSLQMVLFADDDKAVAKASSQLDCQRN